MSGGGKGSKQNTHPHWGGLAATRARGRHWFFHHMLTAHSPELASSQVPQEVDESERQRRLEAVLFLSPEGISSRRAAKLAGLADATEARTLIRQLNLDYDLQSRPYRVEEVAGGFALLTRSNFAPWLRRLSYVPDEVRLGQSAIETLAMVAYRQPVLRANIEAIRGVGCNEILKLLMELDLVRISGRSEDLGRPYLYGTTRRFLQMFGLRSADRLPRIDWVNELSSQQQLAGSDSEVKESTVKTSFSATALIEADAFKVDPATPVEQTLLQEQSYRPASAIDDEDEDEDFDDDDDDFEDDVDDDDDDDDWDDDDDEVEGEEDEDEVDDDIKEDDAEEDDDTEESEWEEVDDDGDEEWDDEDDEDDDDEDDWDEDDEEEEEEDWD